MDRRLLVPIASLWLGACADGTPAPAGPPVDLATTAHDPHPEVPAILRDVAMVDDDHAYTHPYVPGHRTTMDGRVAIRVQGGTADIDRLSTHLSFFLFVPEKLTAPILTGPAGAEILATAEPFDVPFPPAMVDDLARLGHHAICDPTEEMPVPGERTNPYVCGPDTLDDCYDLTIVSSVSLGLGLGAQMWGTPITIRVDQPKTPQARIVEATLGTPVQGAYLPVTTEWTEPAITTDGRLLTGRWGRSMRAWTHPETGETMSRPYDLAYSVLPPGTDPCDVTGWTAFHPMSHAPFDPDMRRYGLAQYPFRDAEGAPIADGEDLGGTYPWVDREGANVFMTGIPGRIVEQSETRFPRRCVHAGCEQYEENTDFDRGFMVAGLWTHGKVVQLDGLINNMDWAVGVHPSTHWDVDLYRTASGEAFPVRFGGGRFIEDFRNGGPYPPGYTHNANILDSLQAVANQFAAARPITPRDVVWIMSSGVATDEIAFDDLLDPNALIVSNMSASITQLYNDAGESTGVPLHHNGQKRVVDGTPGLLALYTLHPDEDLDLHVQNGATSLAWTVPTHGHVDAGTARIEPVALGGIQGRGLWLSGDAAVVYTMPDQGADAVEAYVGLYLDPRAPAGEARELLRFPDGTGIVLTGSSTLTYVDGLETLHTVDLPDATGWVHLGWRIAAGHGAVETLHDGFAIDRWEADAPVFSLDGDDLVVGRHTSPWSGVRGWIDDLVVLAHDVDPEVACNHARGTLVALQEGASADLHARAARYPGWAQLQVAEAAAASGITDQPFVCWSDHTHDQAATLANRPAGTVPVRDAILFPEGPIRYGHPRPDSSGNAFCLSCHSPEGKAAMGLDALAARPGVNAEDDPRRQPHQPPRRVFGNIPAGWIPADAGPGGPDEALQAPEGGALVDQWVLPR